MKIKDYEFGPTRILIKRGIKADNYMDYCMEVGCDIWEILESMPYKTEGPIKGPVGLWLPEKYIKEGTSKYVQGILIDNDYDICNIPEGFDIIELNSANYLVFKGEPFKEEDYCEAIIDVENYRENYIKSNNIILAEDENPRIQLYPDPETGYVVMVPILFIK